jgi:hypothetical protein
MYDPVEGKEAGGMKRVVSMVPVLLAGFLVFTDCSIAGDKAGGVKKAEKGVAGTKEPIVTLTGMIKVAKDANGEVTGIELVTRTGTRYKITMNADAKGLEAKSNKDVELSGIVADMSGEKWFTLKGSAKAAKGDEGGGKPRKKAK